MLSKKLRSKLKGLWKAIGPGFITGVSDDDPSGIASYSQVGALFGLKFLWTALFTYPLMYVIQTMCAKIGIVSQTGLIGIVKKNYSPKIAWCTFLIVAPAIVLNIAANLAGMSAVLNLLFPGIPKNVFGVLIVLITVGYLFFCRYRTVSTIFKLFALALLCYFIIPFLVQENWWEVFYFTFIPHFEWNKEYMYYFVAILGTTLSPYLFFWQSSLSHEHKMQGHNSNATEVRRMKLDVNFGMLTSNLGMYFIILTAASVLFPHGIHIETVQDAAKALEPLAGEFAFLFFALGVLGVGFLAIPVLAGCIGYMLAELLHWSKGLEKVWHQAKAFYAVITASLLIAVGINFIGIDPIEALIFTAVVYGLMTPFILGLILHISNNKKIMGSHTNSLFYNILGFIALVVMSLAALFLIYLWIA
jgi:NRAMP (natural resistance-associated macrophage protein)-like metal ion transporter